MRSLYDIDINVLCPNMEWWKTESESSSYGASRQSRYSASASSEQKTTVDGSTVAAASSTTTSDAFTISGAISFNKPTFKKTAKGVTIERELYIYIEGCLLRERFRVSRMFLYLKYIYTNVYLWCNFVLLKLATMPRSRFSWMRKRAAWRGWRTTNHLTIDWLTASPLRSPMETTTSCASSTAAKVTLDCTRQRLAIATATRQPVPHS